jgi:hypothetical protein
MLATVGSGCTVCPFPVSSPKLYYLSSVLYCQMSSIRQPQKQPPTSSVPGRTIAVALWEHYAARETREAWASSSPVCSRVASKAGITSSFDRATRSHR